MSQKFSFENTIKSKRATGLEVVLLTDGSVEINALVLEKNKSELTVLTKAAGLKRYDDLTSNGITNKEPVVLLLNGKGIIHRNISSTVETPLPEIINKVLPNANIDDFVVQRNRIDEETEFVSLVRKSTFTDILNSLSKVGINNIVNCFLGPFVIQNVLSLVDAAIQQDKQLNFSTYQLKSNGTAITEIKNTDASLNREMVTIGGEFVSAKLLLPFAASVMYFTGSSQSLINALEIEKANEEHQQKQKFTFYSAALLGLSFFILLVNYFVFNHYWSKNQEVNTLFRLNHSTLDKYNTLKAEFDDKKAFLEKNGLLESSKTSFYMDELAVGLPNTIRWLDVNICPKEKNKNTDDSDKISFEKNVIRISGNCERSLDLNNWMKNIKQYDWVSEVSLVDYQQKNKTESGVFLIEVLFR